MDSGNSPSDSRQDLIVGSLRRTRADLIGLGMHGSWVAQALARMGIGGLRLWDHDVVGYENLETQCYCPNHVGQNKAVATASELRRLGYRGKLEVMGQFPEPVDLAPIVISCADQMSVRKFAAQEAEAAGSKAFFESRSLAHTVIVHSFEPTTTNVQHYLETAFPERVAQVACGATGTAIVGMQVAALIGGLLTLSEGGESIALFPGDHEITVGLSHMARPLVKGELN